MKYLKKYNEILQYYSDIDKIKREIESKKEEYKVRIENCIVYLTDEPYISDHEIEFPDDSYDEFAIFLHSKRGIYRVDYNELIDLIKRTIDMLRHELQAEISMVSFLSNGSRDHRNMRFGLGILDKMNDIDDLEGEIIEISIHLK